MNQTKLPSNSLVRGALRVASAGLLALSIAIPANAAVTHERTYKVADNGLYFNGVQTKGTSKNKDNPDVIDFAFGKSISAHGDAIKVYKEFIFTTWYKGGKSNRNLMLSRYNTKTGVLKTIEFPHKHTGYRGVTWIGESHNTAAVGISPKDGKIHLLYDMHSYSESQFKNDYFRYSYSEKNAASVSDNDFKLSLFVADGKNDYTHNNLNGTNDASQYSDLTYPTFFLNEDDDLLFFMRTGGNNNGGYVFTKYNASNAKWDKMTQFNYVNSASYSKDVKYNWGLYGEMKYVDGKLRTAFQTRSANNNDKFEYQNGIYYAYSDDPSGKSQWKTHDGKNLTIPIANPEPLKIFEPGDLVKATGKNQVYIVGGFDFTVTDRGDVHIVSLVKDKTTNKSVKLHSYKPAGRSSFIHTTDYDGGNNLYTAGNNVYLIGLKGGRPYIQVGKGGTNDFTTVYEDKTGPSYGHGVLTIHEGKVYYYLQDQGNTTSMPLHVEVIDLGLNLGNNPSKPTTPSQPDDGDSSGPNSNFTFAADEGGTVKISGLVNVAYGADGKFHYAYNQTQDLECSNRTFGDPIPSVNKSCFVRVKEEAKPVQPTTPAKPSTPSTTCQKYWGSDKTEINLNKGTCVDLPKDLAGKTLQVWDSENASCDFRGVVTTVGGSGRLVIDENYESSVNLTGTTILFEANNSCKYVQMRLY